MDQNKLTSVDQAVFQSLLNCFKKNNISAAISLANSTSRLFLIHLTAYYYIMKLHLLICVFFIKTDPLDCSLPSCYKTFGWISSISSTDVNYFQNATCSQGNSVNALPSSCKVPFIPTTSAPFSTTTKNPKRKKKPMVAFAVTLVESVLASIFQKG